MKQTKLDELLHKKNLRMTQARQVIFDILKKSSTSLSAKEVYERIAKSKNVQTDQASVYRNLTLFTDLGLTHRFQDGRYTLCKQDHGHDSHKHLHIMANCDTCGKTLEIQKHTKDLCEVASQIQVYLKSFGSFENLTFSGKCSKCLNVKPSSI